MAEQRTEPVSTTPPPAADGAPDGDGDARIAALRADLVRLQQRRPAVARERVLGRVGGLLLVAGPVWIAVEYFVAHSTRSGLQQRDAIIGALFGLALTLVGAVLFLRYSGGRLWRYGVSRLAADQDQLVTLVTEALRVERAGLTGDASADDPRD